MPHKAGTGSPAEWLDRARGDLALAGTDLPEGAYLEDLCYHAQQAAEKALKAVYLHANIPFRFIHDLEELLTGLKNENIPVPADLDEAVILTSYATDTRYPGVSEPVAAEEYTQAVALASKVISWAASRILP